MDPPIKLPIPPVGTPVSIEYNIILPGEILFTFRGIAKDNPSGMLCNNIARESIGPKSDMVKN